MQLEIVDDLTPHLRRVWRFYVSAEIKHLRIRLDEYYEQTRKPRARNWVTVKGWASRGSDMRRIPFNAHCERPEVDSLMRGAVVSQLTKTIEWAERSE